MLLVQVTENPTQSDQRIKKKKMRFHINRRVVVGLLQDLLVQMLNIVTKIPGSFCLSALSSSVGCVSPQSSSPHSRNLAAEVPGITLIDDKLQRNMRYFFQCLS